MVGPGLWTTLVECGVSHRALLALIFSILDRKSQVSYVTTCERVGFTYEVHKFHVRNQAPLTDK